MGASVALTHLLGTVKRASAPGAIGAGVSPVPAPNPITLHEFDSARAHEAGAAGYKDAFNHSPATPLLSAAIKAAIALRMLERK